MYNYVNRQLSMIVLMIIMSVCGVGLPYSPNIAVLFVLAFIIGYCYGGIKTLHNKLIIVIIIINYINSPRYWDNCMDS